MIGTLHFHQDMINAALKLSLAGYVTVDMFYTPPLFKVSTVMLFPKKSKKQKKSPGIFWLSRFAEWGFPTSSAPPKMMNWRLLYDSSWPWAHQQLSQWSLQAVVCFCPIFGGGKISEIHGSSPKAYQKGFFCFGRGSPKSRVNQSVNVQSSASRFLKNKKNLRNDSWEKDGEKKKNIRRTKVGKSHHPHHAPWLILQKHEIPLFHQRFLWILTACAGQAANRLARGLKWTAQRSL